MDFPQWKKNLKKEKFKKQKKGILFFLTTVFLVLFFASFFRFYSGIKNLKFLGQKRVNFVINNQKIYLVSLVSGKEVVFLQFPDDPEQKIKLTRGYGEYPPSAIFKLGELDHKGPQLLRETVQEYFAVPIEGVINLENSLDCSIEEKRCLAKIIFLGIKKKNKTDFSFPELFYLWFKVEKTPQINFKTIKMKNLEPATIDSLMAKNLWDEGVNKENYAVFVLNSTGFSGLANQGARFVTNLGGRVVRLGNSDEKDETLIVSRSSLADSYTVKIFKKIFQARWEEGEIEEGRGDIGIYLGKDYWKKLNEKW